MISSILNHAIECLPKQIPDIERSITGNSLTYVPLFQKIINFCRDCDLGQDFELISLLGGEKLIQVSSASVGLD